MCVCVCVCVCMSDHVSECVCAHIQLSAYFSWSLKLDVWGSSNKNQIFPVSSLFACTVHKCTGGLLEDGHHVCTNKETNLSKATLIAPGSLSQSIACALYEMQLFMHIHTRTPTCPGLGSWYEMIVKIQMSCHTRLWQLILKTLFCLFFSECVWALSLGNKPPKQLDKQSSISHQETIALYVYDSLVSRALYQSSRRKAVLWWVRVPPWLAACTCTALHSTTHFDHWRTLQPDSTWSWQNDAGERHTRTCSIGCPFCWIYWENWSDACILYKRQFAQALPNLGPCVGEVGPQQ